MAFPDVATIVDDFNRANETPVGGNWSGPTISGNAEFNLASNRLTQSSGTNCRSYYSATTYGPDVEAYVQIAVTGTQNARGASINFRLSGVETAAATGYEVLIKRNGAVEVWRWDDVGGATDFTQLAVLGDIGTLASGDWLGASIIDDTIRAYHSTDGSTWTEVGTGVADTTYTAAGYVGFSANGSTSLFSLDNFAVATISAAGPQTLTGSSGLASSAAFGSGGSLTPGGVTLTGGSGLASSLAFGSDGSLTPGGVALTGSTGLASSATFGSGGSLTPGGVTVTGSAGLTSSAALGSGGAVAPTLLLTGVSGIASSAIFGSGGSLTPGGVTITGSAGIASSAALGAGGNVAWPQTLTGSSGLASSAAFGSGGSISAALILAGSAGLASSAAFGSGGSLTPGGVTLTGSAGLSSSLAFGSGGTVSTPTNQTLTGSTGFASSAAFGSAGAVDVADMEATLLALRMENEWRKARRRDARYVSRRG